MSTTLEPETLLPMSERLVAEYEELRRVALVANGPSQGVGLALLLRRGMAAWMEACLTAVPSPMPRPAPPQACFLPADLRHEVATVLAAMALAGQVEGGMTA